MPTKSFLLACEPRWTVNRQGARHDLPPPVQSWIYEPGSITQRLRSYYGAAVQVEILFHRWRVPFLSERKLLKLKTSRYALIREVLLHSNGKPLVLARTIIPIATVKAARRNLAHLGNRPLGEVIFSYPKLERLEMDFTLAEPAIWTPAALQKMSNGQALWGRRTIYVIRSRNMLVNEFFFPDALKI
ncbi:MAG: chorismate lyase [Gammaproteobacteria bacterium HGW-Gammaproteobacteria-3]|nr:MAG: chorismate lyase [Gammaproteobacteria bacterium HGW-Gammaproteobacteria-3]